MRTAVIVIHPPGLDDGLCLTERQLNALTQPIQQRIVKPLRALTPDPRIQGVKKVAGEDDLHRILADDDRIRHNPRQRPDRPHREDW